MFPKNSSYAFVLSFSAICCGNFVQAEDDTEIYASEVLTVNVESETVDCEGFAPMKCLVIDGQLFYSGIEGFEFEDGYQYTLQIERQQIYEENNAPQDGDLYRYKLIQIMKKSKPSKK